MGASLNKNYQMRRPLSLQALTLIATILIQLRYTVINKRLVHNVFAF